MICPLCSTEMTETYWETAELQAACQSCYNCVLDITDVLVELKSKIYAREHFDRLLKLKALW